MKKYYKLNHQINYPQVRVITDAGEQLGIMSSQDALKKAQEQEADLVEIAAQANPPVVKIIDFAKFKYLEDKKEKEARKHTKETELKEIRFTPFIGEHDLQTRIDRVKEFLSEGNLVKISIRFKGAQMAHQEFGPKLLARILAHVESIGKEDKQAIMQGRQFVTVLRPTGQKQKQETENKQENKNETENKKSS